MYCKNCGKTIEDNSTFCPYCGANQNAAPTAAECHYDRRKDIRQSELAEINNMIAYFSPKEQQYAEFDRLSRMLGQADREIAAKPKGAIIMGIITLTFTMFGIWATAANSSGWQGFCFTVALIAALPTLVVTGVYIFNRIYWKKQKEKNAPVLAALNDELVNYYDAYGYCPLGIEQTYPAILRDIRDAIVSGYADSTTDAVNYLAQRSHNETMESNAAATAKAAASAAKSAKKAARYSAASFFFK